MFARIKGFLGRHKRKIIVTGGFIGSVIIITQYAQKKFREWQEREAKEFLERTRKQQHFESTERTCNQTIISLAPAVGEAAVKIVNTEDIVSQLRNGHPDKITLWEQLKILAFTRAVVLVYAGAMLVVTLRVQLNLIGGYLFRDSSEASSGSSCISSVVQQRYLSLCHHFMNQGMNHLCSLIQEKIHYVMGGISLKQKLNLQDTEQTFWAVQAAITGDCSDPVKNMTHLILPSDHSKILENLNSREAEIMTMMLTDTVDILESEEVSCLTSSLISRGFSQVVDRVAEYFIPVDTSRSALNAQISVGTSQWQVSPSHDSPNAITGVTNGMRPFIHPNSVSVAMAELIPIVNGLAHHAGQPDAPDPWIQQLILDEKLKLLGANVYEAFSNRS